MFLQHEIKYIKPIETIVKVILVIDNYIVP